MKISRIICALLALLLCLSPLYGHAQRAVFLSEVSSPFGGTTGKIVELYNASGEPADIGKCVIYVSSGTPFEYTIPQGKTIAPKSTFGKPEGMVYRSPIVKTPS